MPPPIANQIAKLRQLRPGWMEPDTPAPDHTGLDWFQQQWERHYPEDAPLAAIFPTEDGNISVEWRIGEYAADMVVDLRFHYGTWGASHVRTWLAEENELNLDDPDDWAWLTNRLAELQADQQP